MSLFVAREYWRATASDQECDQGCLAVANIDNAPNKAEKIIVGSFQGLLRVYMLHKRGYRIEDLMLEEDLGSPILQVAAGRFIAGTTDLALAVLHPRRVVVFAVQVTGDPDNPHYYTLDRAYEHRLERTAANMTFGAFGMEAGRDFLCVQSMDGCLSFFEQESSAFSVYLADFVVPGPMCFVSKTDSIATVRSTMVLESYKYQVLGAASRSSSEQKTKKMDVFGSSKKVQVDWALNLGEHARSISTANVKATSPGQIDIVVLGERTIFIVSEQGALRWQLRLQYEPVSAVAFDTSAKVVNLNRKQNLLVSSQTGSYMIYKDDRLVWATRSTLDRPAVDVRVGMFAGTAGFIVALDDQGAVTVNYLGTDAPTHRAEPDDTKETDFAAMDEEYRRLQRVIRQSSSAHTAAEPTDRIALSVQMGSVVPSTDSVEAKVVLEYGEATGAAENVDVNVHCPAGITVDRPSQVVPTLSGRKVLKLRFSAAPDALPPHLRVRVVAAFVNEREQPRTAQCEAVVPLGLVGEVSALVKRDQFMFTLDIDRDPPPLDKLFADVVAPVAASSPDVARTAAQVLTFVYHGAGRADVTVLVSKKAGRYRLQSSKFVALNLFAHELVRRLRDLDGSIVVSFEEQLPLKDYFTVIDEHFALRKRVRALRAGLEQLAGQFRAVQKRLLVRFKDKNPAPLNNLDSLLRETYQKIVARAKDIDEARAALREASVSLSSVTALTVLLMSIKFRLDPSNTRLLASYLPAEVDDDVEQGWEERTDASLAHLLRTSLAKGGAGVATATSGGGGGPGGGGSAAMNSAPIRIDANMEDTNKLKRHIRLVAERLLKGYKLAVTIKKTSTK